MNNRFPLNEEENNRIRGLHGINEQVVGYGEQGLDEDDAGMDTPGGNPEYFYGDGSLDKIRQFAQQQEESEMSKEDVIEELTAIYSYSQDGATDLVHTTLENLLYKLGGFKDSINEQSRYGIWSTDATFIEFKDLIYHTIAHDGPFPGVDLDTFLGLVDKLDKSTKQYQKYEMSKNLLALKKMVTDMGDKSPFGSVKKSLLSMIRKMEQKLRKIN